MSTGDPELDKKLDILMKKLQDLGTKQNKSILEPVILCEKGSHFYWSINERMFLEVPPCSELYLMTDRGEKEGKCYVFSPWKWNSGAIFLIPKGKIIKIGVN